MPDEAALTAAARESAATVGAFGAELYQQLAQDDTNMVFSPASVASALWMAWCGARGQTAAELARALHLTGPAEVSGSAGSAGSVGSARASGSAPGREDRAAGGSVTLRAPNTVWLQSGLPVRPEFTARLSDAGATFADADFAHAPEPARHEINRVIAEQTAGKITGLLPPDSIGPQTRLLLANAVYLKAPWASPFAPAQTSDAPFYPDGGERPALAVAMMRGTAMRAYLRGDGYQAVLLPYAGGDLAMAVIVPDGPLAALRPVVTARGLDGVLAGPQWHRVTLVMPRFRTETTYGLIPALRQLGVQAAFGPGADFSGITEAGPLQLGAVLHKAYIDVDERGTEAAAATAVGARAAAAIRLPPPVTMVVDRPFLFAIVSTTTGLPLFLGELSRPDPA
jgi:serpin B